MPSVLSKLLLEEGVVSPEQVEAAEAHGKATGKTPGEALEDLGALGADEITRFLSMRYGLPSIALDEFEPDVGLLRILPAETARHLRVVPLSRLRGTLAVATDEPWKTFAFEDVRFLTGCHIEPVVVAPGVMARALERFYGAGEVRGAAGAARAPASRGTAGGVPKPLTREDLDGLEVLEVRASELDAAVDSVESPMGTRTGDLEEIDLRDARSLGATPAARLAILLLVEARKRRASHVLVESLPGALRVRLRIDGVLHALGEWHRKLRRPLTDRIKSMAGMNPLATHDAQQGFLGIRLRAEDRRDDLRFRVSSLPTVEGEAVVLRRLDPGESGVDPVRLGFEPLSFERLRTAIGQPSGLVAIAGPSGSGRTHTLARAVALINRPDLHIVDASPGPELRRPGVNQPTVPPDRQRDVTGFLLAQDPDVLLWDGVPDAAWPALVEAAGRGGLLVLATLDEPDTTAAVKAVSATGVPLAVLARALRAVVAQRLVRRLCAGCRVDATTDVTPEAFRDLGFPPDQWGTFPIFTTGGCAACHDTGYDGCLGLFEVMPASAALRDLISSGAPEHQILGKALEEGMLTLRMSGLEKIRQGITTIGEITRHTDLP